MQSVTVCCVENINLLLATTFVLYIPTVNVNVNVNVDVLINPTNVVSTMLW